MRTKHLSIAAAAVLAANLGRAQIGNSNKPRVVQFYARVES